MKDTALVRMTIDEIAKQKNVSLDIAFDLFYNSKICEMLSDRERKNQKKRKALWPLCYRRRGYSLA